MLPVIVLYILGVYRVSFVSSSYLLLVTNFGEFEALPDSSGWACQVDGVLFSTDGRLISSTSLFICQRQLEFLGMAHPHIGGLPQPKYKSFLVTLSEEEV